MNPKRRGLGKGLEKLLGTLPHTAEALQISENLTASESLHHNLSHKPQELPLNQLQRGQYQPRQDMNDHSLHDLAESIKTQGVLQPILVRELSPNQYEILAGERRYRAAQLAGLTQIPVIIRNVPDESALLIALIENIQRENLNCLEEALALAQLHQEFGLTHQQIAQAVGKSRATVSNLLRLLELPDEIKTMLAHGDLEMAHARTLLSLPLAQQLLAAKTIIAKQLSVRDTEKLVQQLLNNTAKTTEPTAQQHPDVLRLQEQLTARIGTKVQIQQAARTERGKVVMHYKNRHELEKILGKFEVMG